MKMTAMRLIPLLLLLLLGCTDADTPTPGSSADATAEPDAGPTEDAGCWWCVDAGPEPDVPAVVEDDKGGDFDQKCYDACLGKGETPEICKNACGGDDKGDGKGDGKDVKDPDACYDGCVKKGEDPEFCKDYCYGDKGGGKDDGKD